LISHSLGIMVLSHDIAEIHDVPTDGDCVISVNSIAQSSQRGLLRSGQFDVRHVEREPRQSVVNCTTNHCAGRWPSALKQPVGDVATHVLVLMHLAHSDDRALQPLGRNSLMRVVRPGRHRSRDLFISASGRRTSGREHRG
jgi:hypothetical protein